VVKGNYNGADILYLLNLFLSTIEQGSNFGAANLTMGFGAPLKGA
jgi:hypothetical protein